MTAKQPAVKKYIVELNAEERDRLNALIQKGKAPARQLLKARILLKADASAAGDAWSDSRIAEALDTSLDTVARTRQQLVESGVDAALIHKHSPNSARPARRLSGRDNETARPGNPPASSGKARTASTVRLRI